MDVGYLIADRFGKHDLKKPPGEKNPGGGLAVKAQRAIEVLQRYYRVFITEDIGAIPASCKILVVDPSWFVMRGHLELATPDIESAIQEYREHSALIRILYSTEQSFMELLPSQRQEIVEISDVITTPCDYLAGLYMTEDIRSFRLCDPVPDIFDYNDQPKTNSVIAIGVISRQKNSQHVADVFEALEGKNVERIYAGGAALWGTWNTEDINLEQRIKQHTDSFYDNLDQTEMSELLQTVKYGLFVTIHETGSESNLEACRAGTVGLYGDHALWNERPGFHNLYSVEAFIETIELDNANARSVCEWAKKECSYETFEQQWKKVIEYAKSHN